MAMLAPIGIAASIAGAGIGAAGALSKGSSEAGMYNYQAGVADINSKIAKQNAAWSLGAGGVQAEQLGQKQAQRMGAIKAGQGANGLDVNSGSASGVRTSQTQTDEQDQGIVQTNAARRAYGYEVESAKFDADAAAARASGENAKTAGMFGAMSSLISGASSVASKWTQG